MKKPHVLYHSKECLVWLLKKVYLIILCVRVLSACMFMHHTCACCLWRLKEVIKFPGMGVTDSCEWLCGPSGRATSAFNPWANSPDLRCTHICAGVCVWRSEGNLRCHSQENYPSLLRQGSSLAQNSPISIG